MYSLYPLLYRSYNLLSKLFGIWFVMSFSYRYMPKYWCDIYNSGIFIKYPRRAYRGTFIRAVIWTAMRNAETPYMKRAFIYYGVRAFLLKCNMVTRIPFSLWVASPARKQAIMLVNYKVPHFFLCSWKWRHFTWKCWGVRACISLAIYTHKKRRKQSLLLLLV